MRVAITGATGFVGSHLAEHLERQGHEVVSISRRAGVALEDVAGLRTAFTDVDAVVHCAGINRELGEQTYQRVHTDGTRHVVAAAQHAGVRKLVMLSFLRARPACGSPYHESKWEAEEFVRQSGLDYTILKAGMIFGRGDHMIDHLSHALFTFPFFSVVGFDEQPIQPVSVHDIVRILDATLTDSRLANVTVPVVGPERMTLSEASRRVGAIIGKRRVVIPAPIWFHWLLARVAEFVMVVPLASRAQVRMLAEGVVEPVLVDAALPPDLLPTIEFAGSAIVAELPPAGGFGRNDLRCRVAA